MHFFVFALFFNSYENALFFAKNPQALIIRQLQI